ncbi:UV excision repair protein Rad23 [Morchella conica CCBAS932]|uniref:UV excision repair protein RAD23 n=1 Tax=Morchella conica CCBAS932 TaxID=1392247 RepID=A0A3N4KT18_9PEZI|nr:UV excision repair protein Rad23 [Morchella conica CCBAS932]
MKLTFKDLKQQKFLIDAEPSDTIGQLKEKITAEKGWDASLQKLIYSGKILQDDKTVESYNIEEKGFVVCMVSKAAATPAKVPSTPAQPTVPATPSAPAQSAAASSSSSAVPETPTPAGSGSAAPSNFNDPSALAMGGDGESAIQNMIAMGFERSEAERAMRAAFFNPDRAVDYLLNGIPDHVQQERQPQSPATRPAAQASSAPRSAAPAGGDASAASNPENINLFEAAAAAASQRSGGGTRGGTGAGGLGNLDFLRNNPQFQQLRQVVQQQPQMLEPILQQVGTGNPQLAALISQNPDAFLQLLSEDPDDGEGAPLPPGAQQIAVTPEERDAIERLCRLGFDRDMVIQAYFACDKNEELAANFLFEQPDDDMEP